MPSPDDALSSPASSTPLPPTLTPATTTRHSVALGVLDTIWSNPEPHSIPAIVTNAPSPASETPTPAHRHPSQSPAVLPPPQSAALRALNAPAFQSHLSPRPPKSAKSSSSQTTLSSQPVVVRTYSGARHTSRPSSGITTPRIFPTMSGSSSHNNPASTNASTAHPERLPAVDDFSFSAILRAVDPEIRDAIDAIAEICARSRLSLADEYDAHLPPQGEIVNAGGRWGMGMGALVGRGRMQRVTPGWSAAENTLMAVPEASSSSERLAGSVGGSVRGKGKKSRSAYGSLKSVFSAGSVKVDVTEDAKGDGRTETPHWAVTGSSSTTQHPSITLITSPRASKHLSLDISAPDPATAPLVAPDQDHNLEHKDQHSDTTLVEPSSPTLHSRHTSVSSIPHSSQPQQSALSSLASWIPWSRLMGAEPGTLSDATRAETRLKEMLRAAKGVGDGKGKVVVRG